MQVGCRRACGFCATGTMGLQANLRWTEILAQVEVARALAEVLSLPPLRNVVFMGMGEPLDNARHVAQALAVLTHPKGLGVAPRHVTVSTVAPSLAALELLVAWPCHIAWSLHSADDAVRAALVPTTAHRVSELANAVLDLASRRNQRIFVEMTLIDGVNDRPRDADLAARLFEAAPRRVRFNLLAVNPTEKGFRPPPDEKLLAFRDRLRAHGHFAMVRRPRGRDRSAACGQLVTLPGARWRVLET
ncbi:MAG: radical SAM protein [Myxococcales bacterium]|nr:radical SAM protein [Myxococcales bacterium]